MVVNREKLNHPICRCNCSDGVYEELITDLFLAGFIILSLKGLRRDEISCGVYGHVYLFLYFFLYFFIYL